jgi:hypothetical protein
MPLLLEKINLKTSLGINLHLPSFRIGSQSGRQQSLDLVFESPRVLRVVNKEGLELKVSLCVSTKQQGEPVLCWRMALGSFLLHIKKRSGGHLLPEQCCLINIKYLSSTTATLFNQFSQF